MGLLLTLNKNIGQLISHGLIVKQQSPLIPAPSDIGQLARAELLVACLTAMNLAQSAVLFVGFPYGRNGRGSVIDCPGPASYLPAGLADQSQLPNAFR